MGLVYKNGFFQLVLKEDGIYLKLFPAASGGFPISYDEVSKYLSGKKIEFDVKELHEKIVMTSVPAMIKISNGKTYPENEKMDIFVPSDRMSVICRFIPPSTGAKMMAKEEIISSLRYAGVKFGLDEAAVEEFLQSRQYCTDLIFARGKEPRHGKDARIIYHFNTNRAAKPKQNEDGSVDFHDLGMIANVKKGSVLAVLEKEDPGDPGTDVLGNMMKPRTVQRLVLRHGKNIHMSEDGLMLYADTDGHAILEEGRVFVANTYEVAADVDTSTGDINYEGNVQVKGNVRTGFSVHAQGDIIVEGVVEGAVLEAGGQIILKRGIQGMSRGILTAGSNVIAKFIESSTVKAEGYISTDAIMHSKVQAKGDIIVDGKKGFVTGGEVRSGSMIMVRTAGSTMGTNTLLEVGIDPEIMEEYHRIEKRLEVIQKDKEKLLQFVNIYRRKIGAGEKFPVDKMIQIKSAATGLKNYEEEEMALADRLDGLEEQINSNETGRIKVVGAAYPGVKLVIANVVSYVRTVTQHSQFIREGADIKIVAL